MITIQLLFAAKNSIWRQSLTLPAQTTAQEAILQSTLYQDHPEAKVAPYGVFGERCSAETLLQDGDRLEIYRPLVFDPMESRRRRAQHRVNT